MVNYIIRRLLLVLPMLLGVSIILFVIVQATPGGPEAFFMAQGGEESGFSQDQIETIRRNLGLDDPIHVQYYRWLSGVVSGDLGISFVTRAPVAQHIGERLPNTLQLTMSALLLAIMIGIPIGVISAVYQYSLLDKSLTLITFFLISFPAFWLGIMLILIFAVTLGWLPPSGIAQLGQENVFQSRLIYAILPTLTLMLERLAAFVRYTRSSMLEVLNQDYIRTARAKGLSASVVRYKHALRNSLIPVLTIMGLQLTNLLAGSALVEMVFSWPGLGRLAVLSVQARDYPMIMGINLMLATVVIMGNLLVDIAYAVVDPRISYS